MICTKTRDKYFRQVTFFMMLYGSLEYDPRAKRLLDVLTSLGNVILVDLAAKVNLDSIPSVLRRSVQMPADTGVIRRHLRFWWTALAEVRRYCPKAIVGANFFTTFPAWIASKLTGTLLIYDAYELIIPGGLSESMSWRNRFWYFMERLMIRRADLIIAANEDRARLMKQHYGLKMKPIVMRNIPPKKHNPNPIEKASIIAKYPELTRRFPCERLLLYSGNVNLSRGIDRFVQALTYLPKAYRLIVVGSGPNLESLRYIGRSFEQEGRFTTLGRVEHCLMPFIISIADVGIVTYPFKGQNNIYCAPNKIFEYAQVGLPIVTTNQPPLREIVEKYGIGELISEHDGPDWIAVLIQKVVENRVIYKKALPRFLEDHRWKDEAGRVRAAVDGIMSLSR
ncbi:hypothetical protein ES704_00054 [subsurface metagenome]|jgi:glycosyltransferase involved in cell wall biosynthesis